MLLELVSVKTDRLPPQSINIYFKVRSAASGTISEAYYCSILNFDSENGVRFL